MAQQCPQQKRDEDAIGPASDQKLNNVRERQISR